MTKQVKCDFFSKCGGCDFLDLTDEEYQRLKKENLEKDLENIFKRDENLVSKIAYNFIGAKSRRRIILQIDSKNNLGFFAKKSRSLVEINSCYIAEEKISQLILPLKKLIKSQELNLFTQVSITLFDNSIDLIFQVKKDLNFGQIQKIILFAKEYDVNISYKIKNHVTPIYLPKKNQIFIGDYSSIDEYSSDPSFFTNSLSISTLSSSLVDASSSVTPYSSLVTASHDGVHKTSQQGDGCRPKDGMTMKVELDGEIFIQATKKGLESIVKLIRNFLKQNKNIKKVADIYAGFGAYSFAICDLVSSVAYEGSEKMVDLISKNAISNSLSHRVKAIQRDLFQDAITKNEINNFDLIIINPPRNGATPQIKEITKSKVKNVIYISCNPKTFAFDAEILLDFGFKIESLSVIDQFYGGKHMELAAFFSKV